MKNFEIQENFIIKTFEIVTRFKLHVINLDIFHLNVHMLKVENNNKHNQIQIFSIELMLSDYY